MQYQESGDPINLQVLPLSSSSDEEMPAQSHDSPLSRPTNGEAAAGAPAITVVRSAPTQNCLLC